MNEDEEGEIQELTETETEILTGLVRQATQEVHLSPEDLDDGNDEAEYNDDDDADEDLKVKAEEIIKKACSRVAMTSFASSGFGFGRAAAFALGVAATQGIAGMQGEMVNELAKLYGNEISPESKTRVMMLLQGVGQTSNQIASNAASAAASQAVEGMSQQIATEVAKESIILKALPLVSPLTNAVFVTSSNVVATYVIGKRATIYFQKGEDSVPSWKDSVRMLSGVDERRLVRWIVESYSIFKDKVKDQFQNAREKAKSSVRGAMSRAAAATKMIANRLSFRKGKTKTETGDAAED